MGFFLWFCLDLSLGGTLFFLGVAYWGSRDWSYNWLYFFPALAIILILALSQRFKEES